MITILPPLDRINFKSNKDFKKASSKWKKMFDSAMKYSS